MDVPSTVESALEDRPVSGATCLEAGAGVGNTTAGLVKMGASRVYAVTNERDHALGTRDRIRAEIDSSDRLTVLLADLCDTPLADDSVDLVTAHGLFNVLPLVSATAVAAELTRVARPGCHLVVDDYDPLPVDAAITDLFAAENAMAELVEGRSALTFYPVAMLRALFEGDGWVFDRERTLLDPVPWTAQHIDAHAAAARELADDRSDAVSAQLVAEIDRLSESMEPESTGRMYSLAFRLRE